MIAIQTKLDGVNGTELTAWDAKGQKVTIPYPFDLDGTEAHISGAKAFCEKYGLTPDFLTGYLGKGVYVHVLKNR